MAVLRVRAHGPILVRSMAAPGDLSAQLDRVLLWRDIAAELFGDPPAALTIGHYRMESVLGAGSSGSVYRGVDQRLQRPVALKVLRSDEGRGRIMAEARALARISHPNVVTIHAVEQLEGEPCIVMELIGGPTLTQWQARPERTWLDVLDAYAQVGEGLAAAHERSLVHRDFKPDNVRITTDDRPVVLDFGLSHPLDGRASGGTPAYAAPEQVRGEPVTPWADQFAFCVALFEALFGQAPFEVSSEAERLQEIEAGRIVTPELGSVPREVETILRRGLQPTPSRRWSSMRTLLIELWAASAGDPDERSRRALLSRVDAFWLHGVLASSLPDGEVLDVPLRLRSSLESGGRERVTAGASEPVLLSIDAASEHPGLVVLVGPAGSGKTTALLRIAQGCLTRARRDPREPVPVVLGLGSWRGHHHSLDAWVLEELHRRYSIPQSIAEPWLRSGRIRLFLDGLDEIERRWQAACRAAIEDQCARGQIPCVLATRTETEPTPKDLPVGGLIASVEPLSIATVGAFVRGLEPTHPLARLDPIDQRSSPFLRSPLALVVLARTAAERPTSLDAAEPDTRWARLWSGYVDRMLDASSRVDGRTTARRLRLLARAMQQHGRTQLWLEELQPGWLRGRTARIVQFLLPALVVGLGNALIALWFMTATIGTRAGLLAAIGTIPVCVAFVMLVAGARHIEPVEHLRWSWAQTRRRAAGAARRAGLSALAIATLAAIVWAVPAGLEIGLGVFAIQLPLWSVVLFLVFATLDGMEVRGIERVAANLGIARSFRTMLYVGSVTLLVVGGPLLAFGALVPPPVLPEPLSATPRLESMTQMWRDDPRQFFLLSLAVVAVSVAYLAGILRGGYAVVQHWTLRVLMALDGLLPLRAIAWLDQLVEHALMRRVGGGYLFVHPTLGEYLAARVEDDRDGPSDLDDARAGS